MDPTDTIRAFWQAMNGNDWEAVAARFLAPDFTGLWPQSGEVIDGPASFARINAAFPGQGDWRFEVLDLIAQGPRIVTDTRITNAPLAITARAITFHTLSGPYIQLQREFWPDPYPVPEWRRGLLPVDQARAGF